MTKIPNAFDILAEAASNHIRITHTALSDAHRAEVLLNDRMLDFLQDWIDGDTKDPKTSRACEQINFVPGPLLRAELRQAAARRIVEIRHL